MQGEPLRCPNDGARLVEIERSDVLIDACPECRGVWLDRGELDKILVKERQLQAGADEDFFSEVSGRRTPTQPSQPPARGGGDHYEQPRKKKRRSLLEELLDFD